MRTTVENHLGEKLELAVGGKEQTKRVIIFVHGFGVDMHETGGLFDYEAEQLGNRFLTVQFSLSGCGQSEGESEDMDYEKHAADLEAVITWVRRRYPEKKINLITHSMGGFVTLLLSPRGVERTIMVGLPNYDVTIIKNRLVDRFKNRPGAVLNVGGVSVLPRSSGLMQKIGPSFWTVLNKMKPLEMVKRYLAETRLKVIHMRQDEILGNEFIEDYHQLDGVEAKWIEGDHSVTKPEYRKQLMKEIDEFIES